MAAAAAARIVLDYSLRGERWCSPVDKDALMYDADFGDMRFVLLVVAAFVLGIAGSLTQVTTFLP